MIKVIKETYFENLKSSKNEMIGEFNSYRDARLVKERLENSETSKFIFYRIEDTHTQTETTNLKKKNHANYL